MLYNGNVAFKKGKENLIATFQDDYWQMLPVEQLEISDEITVTTTNRNPNFKIAEEKAVKAIQKHSMEIDGKQRNKQIDEAYLLLGKSRYFDQRFIPALEAFNYILFKYHESDNVNEARVWRAKTNIRLENEEVAIKNLQRLFKKEKLSTQIAADAHATLGQAYINIKELDSAVVNLKKATAKTKNNEQKGRYSYIVGQLYNRLGDTANANNAFDAILKLNRKTPRMYLVNAYLGKANNFNLKTGNKAVLLEMLTELEENRENRPYLDKIYYQLANYHLQNDSVALAKTYFNKSLRTNTRDTKLKARNYETLATVAFNEKAYAAAGAYYDSTLTNLTVNTKKHTQIKRKRDNLTEVIQFEERIAKNDSILQLVKLSETERIAFFESVIKKLKEEEAAAKEKEEATQQRGVVASPFNTSKASNNTTFYFYNMLTVAYGKNKFRKIWGDRKLEDNWRLENKTLIINTTKEVEAINASAKVNEKYEVNYYVKQIPTDKNQIDSIAKDRNNAYYQLGLIYKEKLREYPLAIAKLETLLANNPEEALQLPAKYHLYKMYVDEDPEKVSVLKNDILSNYPTSRYAQILENPELVLADNGNNPETIYTNLYKKLEAQEFETVINDADSYITQFNGEAIAAKFDMLKAMAIGRLKGFKAYKKALTDISVTYPNESIAKNAQNRLQALKKVSDTTFNVAATGSYKVVFPFQKTDTVQTNKLYKTVQKSLKNLNYTHINVSKDVYDVSQTFVVVHGFKNEEFALGYAELLKINKKYRIKRPNWIILADHYKTIQIHKNLETYKVFKNNIEDKSQNAN